MGNRLYVGNLSFATTEVELLDLFKQSGSVAKCELVMDKFTNRSRGFAFVEMASNEDATKAIMDLNGTELGGRTLTVNEARPREERPRREFNNSGGANREPRRQRQRTWR